MTAKSLQLWFKSKEFAGYLSGVELVTADTLKTIKRKTGLSLSQSDILSFPRLLSSFPKYHGVLYCGVSRDNSLYQQIASGNSQVTTIDYHSCFKSQIYGRRQSSRDRILLIIHCSHNFDISQFSQQQEVILDRNIRLEVDYIDYESGSSNSINEMLFDSAFAHDVTNVASAIDASDDDGFLVVQLHCTT